MNSHHFDVIVVGAGISGLTAAGASALRDQKVALVATGPGEFALGSGCLEAQEFVQPGVAHEMAEAIAFFREMTEAAGCHFAGDIADVCALPTILGEFQRVALAPRSHWNSEVCHCGATAIVGIRELSYFDENFMAERLNEQARMLSFAGTYTARQISLVPFFEGPVTTVRIAARFDSDPDFRAGLADTLRLAATGFERILIPSILGLHSSSLQLAQFERELGCSLGEIPTLPPSVSGLRLFNRLRGYLHEIGVELFQGFPVQKLAIHDGLCTELEIASPGHYTILRGESVVLAVGQHSADLLGGKHAGHDELLRPLSSAGPVMAWNIFVAGSGPHDRSKGGGDVIDIVEGYRAGNAAAAIRRQYAAG